MTTTDDVDKVEHVFKQLTKMTFFSAKLEWRIEHRWVTTKNNKVQEIYRYRKFRGFYKLGQLITSKMFVLPRLSAVWQLDVYPSGRSNTTYVDFYLRLVGFQTPDGSLSDDKTKGATVPFKIYVLSGTNQIRMVAQSLSDFKIGSIAGGPGEIDNFIHPDGSLLVICEVECLASEETFTMASPSNTGMLYPNPQLTACLENMWKSQLFTDCTLKVGEKSFTSHKCILAQWSEVFRNMFSLPMEEADSGIVEISDFSADAISAMLQYMYTGSVNNDVMEMSGLELLALADKYAVIPLKEMCEDYLASTLTTTNVLQRTTLADRSSAAKLKKACVNRLAIDGRAALRSQEWENLKRYNKCLADELLEILIKDHSCFADMQEEATKDTN